MSNSPKDNLETMFELLLRRVYQAEKEIYQHLKKAIKQSEDVSLKEALQAHELETEESISRLQRAFDTLELSVTKTKVGEAKGILQKGKEMVKDLATFSFTVESKSIQGILAEADDLVATLTDTPYLDLAIVCSHEWIDRGQVSLYKTLIKIAKASGHNEILDLFEKNLEGKKRSLGNLEPLVEKKLQKLFPQTFNRSNWNETGQVYSNSTLRQKM